jgi:hypothetical protein
VSTGQCQCHGEVISCTGQTVRQKTAGMCISVRVGV